MVASRVVKEEDRSQSAEDFALGQSDLFAAGFSFSGHERDLLCLSLGGNRFLDISGVSGADSVSDGRAAVRADFDNDGDLDIFLRALHGPSHFLLANQVGQDAGWIRIALSGTASGKDAFGAVVRLKTAAGVLTRIKSGGSGFVSQSDPRLLFGLGPDERSEWLEVTWPSGLVQRHPGPPAGASLLLIEDEDASRRVAEKRFQLPAPLTAEQRTRSLLRVQHDQGLADVFLATLDGRQQRLSSVVATGKLTVLVFWATWCRSCATEMPHLQVLAEQGATVIAISLDDPGSRSLIPSFLTRHGITYPVFTIDGKELDRLFTTPDIAIPLSLVLDGNLEVREILQGWSAEKQENLGKLLAPGPTEPNRPG